MNKTRYFKNLASLHLNIKMLADWKKRLALNIITDWFYLYNVDQRRAIEMTRRTATNSMDGKNILGNCIIPHPVSIKPLIKTIVVMQFVYCLFFFSFSFFLFERWGNGGWVDCFFILFSHFLPIIFLLQCFQRFDLTYHNIFVFRWRWRWSKHVFCSKSVSYCSFFSSWQPFLR